MKRSPCSLVLFVSGVLTAPLVVRAAEAANPILTPAASSSQPAAPVAKPRAVSSQTAQRLAAVMPPYAPPVAAKTEPEPEDKPRNEIIRLPRYEVREPKLPPLSEYQMLTPKGKVDLAMKVNPGLRFGSLWIFSNDGVAVEMLEEAAARERRRQMADLMSLLPAKGGTSVTPAQQRLLEDALTPHNYTQMSDKR